MAVFLSAEWRKLAMANYAVEPSVLEPFIPKGTELDLWKNTCYVSLVGFMFLNTKLKGIKVPFHSDFEEVNLRFYVKRCHPTGWRRGVVFIKEFVPKPALTFVANAIYKEHYQTVAMKHNFDLGAGTGNIKVEYGWKLDKWNSFKVTANSIAIETGKESEEEFITEHYWGYTKLTNTNTSEYEVRHPRWKVYPVTDYAIDVDFSRLYGTTFSSLTSQKPLSVFLAEGSEITVRESNILREEETPNATRTASEQSPQYKAG